MQEFFHQQYRQIWKDSKEFKPMKHNKSPSFFDDASKCSGLKTSIKIPSFKLIPPNFQLKQQIQGSKIHPLPPAPLSQAACCQLQLPPFRFRFDHLRLLLHGAQQRRKGGMRLHLGVSKNRETPQIRWWKYWRNPYFLMDDLGGKGTTIFGNHP